MKKRIMFGLFGVVAMAAAAIVTVSTVNASSTESDLLSKNLEALTQNEGNCNNTNGYRSWETTADWFEDESEFYDCCSVLRHGYDASGNCN